MSMLLLIALLCSTVAALIAAAASRRAVRASAACSTLASQLQSKLKSCDVAMLRVTELDDLCAATQRSVAKLRSRAGMRELRAAASDEDDAQEQLRGAQWKEKMRAQLRLNLSKK